jgi:hypothetical protein
MLSFLFRVTFFTLLMFTCLTAWAAKTDVVYMKNGDRLTGEVKSLQRGLLHFKTDHMGTVLIEWEDILEIVSDTGQSIELINGQRFYGPLTKPDNEDMVAITTEQGTVGMSIDDVISMYPVKQGFWNRLDVSARLGFSWDKGSQVGRYNLGMDAVYRDAKFITRADLSSEITTQDDRDNTERARFAANHVRFRGNKRFTDIFGSMDKNDELGLDLRVLLGAGYGWIPVRSNKDWFSVAVGLDVNHEIPREGDSETNLEAVGMLLYEYYKYNTPQRKFSTSLLVFPSITDFGRWRADFKTNFRLELVSDLFWVMEFYATMDSRPLSENAANSDYGVISSFAYKF